LPLSVALPACGIAAGSGALSADMDLIGRSIDRFTGDVPALVDRAEAARDAIEVARGAEEMIDVGLETSHRLL
jgi:hypothetical protein